jgi:4Fe-4S ferredoxin
MKIIYVTLGESVINTHGVNMPKHIISGLKYLATVELRKKGHNQREIAEELDMDRSTVSHYLNGRNVSWNSIEIAEVIRNTCPKDFLTLTYTLFKDEDKTRTIIKTCLDKKYVCKVKNSCIGCGICVDACMMNSVVLDDLKARIDPYWCCGCLICVEMCPTNSIEIKEVEVDGNNRND